MNQKISKADELFFTVDENNQPLKPLPRKLVHGHGVWHRVSHIWIQNGKGELLCQQRSMDKELLPGFWECFFGGHIKPNESYGEAAIRELSEELGIHVTLKDLRLWKIYKFYDNDGYNNEFMGVFIVNWDGKIRDLKFDDGEVARATWKSTSAIREAILEKGGKSWTNIGYEVQLLDELEDIGVYGE